MSDTNAPCAALEKELASLLDVASPPAADELASLFSELNDLYTAEEDSVRPRDADGRPGGLVVLDGSLPAIVIPDIHARPGFVWKVLQARPLLLEGESVLEALCASRCQLVCVGDYFHGEGRVRQRWQKAFLEYSADFRRSPAMDAEMAESFAVLRMLGLLKLRFPRGVQLLKGNHENVANESGNGNHAFGKYAYEGAMVALYVEIKYGLALLDAVADFEKSLPLAAVAPRFVISHAEPALAFNREDIIEYRSNDEVIYGLTWTADGGAEEHSVGDSLDSIIEDSYRTGALWFGGHRPVEGRFKLRANGEYVQINNPDRYVMAALPADRPADPERDIIDVGEIEDAQDDTIS